MKKSKYEMMIGSVVSMSFADVEVTGYKSRKPEGKKYYKREIEIDNLLWVSVQSFEKQSFSKRYFKAIEESKKVVKEEEPVKYEIRAMSDIYCWRGDRSTEVARAIDDMANIDSIPELKKYFNTECKKFHPDHGGNAEDFAEVRFWYEEELRNIESIQTALDEILNESVVEPVDELHDLKTTYNLKDLKNAYRTLARRYHPDNLDTGDSDRFKLAKTIYDVRKLMIEEILEVFGYDDPNFAELVDMTEDLHKSLHKIVY